MRGTERQPRGVALLEVVVALSIFFMAAMFVMDGLNSSLRAVHRAQVEADAADLAATILADIQIGILEIKNDGPFIVNEELYPGWTYEVVVTGIDDLPDLPLLKRVEVIVRNDPEEFTYRTTQLIWDDTPS